MNKIVSLMSGGIDSIVLTYTLAQMYPDVIFEPLYFRSKNSGAYWEREEGANKKCWDRFHGNIPNVLEPTYYAKPEIKVSRGRTAYRNQIFLETVARLYKDDPDVTGITMGVCPGQEEGSWVHGWTLAKEDHSPEFLRNFLKKKAPNLELITFDDFKWYHKDIGQKDIRVKLGIEYLGEEWLWETQSCQLWFLGKKRDSYLGEGTKAIGGCGKCHSCIARYVAITNAIGYDKTPYRLDPLRSRWLLQYAVEYKNMDLFIKGFPYTKDFKMMKREMKAWIERLLNGSERSS